jgi:hypothetical membrane protein
MSRLEQIANFKNIPKENIIGYLAPLVTIISIVICTAILPGFDWADNPLSDMGSWSRTDLGDFQILSAILFNGSLIVTGLLCAYFAIWMIKQFNDQLTKIALLLFVGNSLFLAGVGIFSEDFSFPHVVTAVSFFLSIPIALGIIGLVWLRLEEVRNIGIVSIMFALLSLLIMFQPWIDFSTAVFETLEALVVMGWLWFVNTMQYKGRFASIQIE